LRPSIQSPHTLNFTYHTFIGNWGDLKSKLGKALSDDAKYQGTDGARRALVLMLKLLSAAVCEGADVGQCESMNDAVAVYREIVGSGSGGGGGGSEKGSGKGVSPNWGQIEVFKSWKDLSTRDVLLDALPIHEVRGPKAALLPPCHAEIGDLPVPLLDVGTAALVHSTTGVEISQYTVGGSSTNNSIVSDSVVGSVELSATELAFAEEMYAYLELERKWVTEHARITSSTSTTEEVLEDTLSDKWAELDAEYLRNRDNNNSRADEAVVRVPLGEFICL